MFINCNDDENRVINMGAVVKVLRVGQYVLEVTYKDERVVELYYNTVYDTLVDFERMNLIIIKRNCTEVDE